MNEDLKWPWYAYVAVVSVVVGFAMAIAATYVNVSALV